MRDARLKAGLTQEALAFAAEVDQTYVSYLENDQKSPTLAMLVKLCRDLKLPVSELIKRAEKVAGKLPNVAIASSHPPRPPC